jgi:hypothetical protein
MNLPIIFGVVDSDVASLNIFRQVLLATNMTTCS